MYKITNNLSPKAFTKFSNILHRYPTFHRAFYQPRIYLKYVCFAIHKAQARVYGITF